ncbi:hypothetical protein HDV01_003539 [Terramyces sp. JEL0728]|nr:hypothetical protein HDV01_003539 [Terramyces sp. JEL0728]
MNTLDMVEETITLDQLMEDEFQQDQGDHEKEHIPEQPGFYVAISDYYHTGQLKVSLGDVVKVTSVNNGYCYGTNQSSNEQGLLPLDILVLLSNEVFQPQDLFEEEEELISMNELNTLSLDYTTHCLETENETSIYFAWRYGGESVSVWGSFNDWQRPIQLFYDSVTTIFVCFTETTLAHGDLCFFKFVVDDHYQVDPTLPTITNQDGTFNYIVICTRFCQGTEHSIDIQQVYKIMSNQSITEYDYSKDIQFTSIPIAEYPAEVESVVKETDDIPEQLAKEIRLDAENREAVKLQEMELQNQLELEKLKLELDKEKQIAEENGKAMVECIPADIAEALGIDAENQEAVKLQELEINAEAELQMLRETLAVELRVTEENENAISEIVEPISEELAKEIKLGAENQEAVKLQSIDVASADETAIISQAYIPQELAEQIRIEAENLEALKLQNLEIEAEIQLAQLRKDLDEELFATRGNELAMNKAQETSGAHVRDIQFAASFPYDLSQELGINAENQEEIRIQEMEMKAEEKLGQLKKDLEIEMLISKENEQAINETIHIDKFPEFLVEIIENASEEKEVSRLEKDILPAVSASVFELPEHDFIPEVKAKDIATINHSGALAKGIADHVGYKVAPTVVMPVQAENSSDFDSNDEFEIAHVNANIYDANTEYLGGSQSANTTAFSSKRSSAVARREIVAHFHHTELEFESELADLSRYAKSSHYNEQFIDALKQEASRFAENLYRLDALIGRLILTVDGIDSPYNTALSHKLELEIFGESLDDILPERTMMMEKYKAEKDQEQVLAQKLVEDVFDDYLEEILPETVAEEERVQLEDMEELSVVKIEISTDIEKMVLEQIPDFLPDELLMNEKVSFEESVVSSNSSPSLHATREILKEFSRPIPEQISVASTTKEDFAFSTGTPDEDDSLSYEEYTQHEQLAHHLDRISNLLNMVKNPPPEENYRNTFPVDILRSLQLASESKEESKIHIIENTENDLIVEIIDRFESPVEPTFSEWKFVTSVDHIEFHEDQQNHEKHLSIQTDVTYSSGASSSDTIIESPVFEKFSFKKSPTNSPPSDTNNLLVNLNDATEDFIDNYSYLPPTIPLPNIPANSPAIVQPIPRNISPTYDSNRMSDLIDSLSKEDFPSSNQPQSQAPPSYRPNSRTASKPLYRPSPLSFPPITRQEPEDSSSPEPASPSNPTKEVQQWEEIPLTPSTLVANHTTSMFSPEIDKYISIALAVACIANIKLLLSVISASWTVIRIFHMVWTFAGLVFLFGHLL